MFSPRCDIYFDINLIELNNRYIFNEIENSIWENQFSEGENPNSNKKNNDEMKEILDRMDEIQ